MIGKCQVVGHRFAEETRKNLLEINLSVLFLLQMDSKGSQVTWLFVITIPIIYFYRMSHHPLDTLFMPISLNSDQLEYKCYKFFNCPFNTDFQDVPYFIPTNILTIEPTTWRRKKHKDKKFHQWFLKLRIK